MPETAPFHQPLAPGRTISWNGIGFNAPAEWTIVRLDLDGMVMELHGEPTLSVGWSRSSAPYRPDKDLERLERDLEVKAEPMAGDCVGRLWSDAVLRHTKRNMKVLELSWTARDQGGIGAHLHNPESGLTMILLFHLGRGCTEREAAKVLYSVRDHWGGESLPIAVYDFRARVGSEYRMTGYRHDAEGHHLEFRREVEGDDQSGGTTDLILEYRPGARELLDKRTLEQWLVATWGRELPGRPLTVEPGRVSWSGPAPLGLWARFAFRVEHCRGRAWIDGKRDALFLVGGRGTLPVSKNELADLCEFFEAG